MSRPPLADYPYPVIDAHAHLGAYWPDESVFTSLEDGIDLMNRCGIARACTSMPSFQAFDFREGNRVTADAVQRFPGRLIGFCVVDPRRPADTADELDRCLGESGFRGIKLHVTYCNVPYDDSAYDPVYERARRFKAPVLAHTFNRVEVDGLLNAARRFPDVPFIVGHSGGYAWLESLAAIAAVPNAFFDVCCSCQDNGRVEAFAAAGGATRMVFGTDAPLLHPACDLSQVVHARISDADRRLILGGNILRMLGERP